MKKKYRKTHQDELAEVYRAVDELIDIDAVSCQTAKDLLEEVVSDLESRIAGIEEDIANE